MNFKKQRDLISFFLILGILVFLNIIFYRYFFRIDLTEDKRYTISPATKEALQKLESTIYIEVYLEGELTPDYARLQRSVKETLDEFRIYAGDRLQYRFVDPNSIVDEKLRKQYFQQLVEKGVQYKYDLTEEGGKKEERIIFPSALLSYKGKESPILFLKGSKVATLQEQLNQAVEGVEFELMSALRKVNSNVTKSMAFIEGHGEIASEEVADISSSLSEFYHVDRIFLNDSVNVGKYKMLVIAGPEKQFTEKEKFVLDQYLVKGGNIMFFIDALNLNKDSLQYGKTFAFSYNLNLDDLLFKYGIRLNGDLIQDLNGGLLRLDVGANGQSEMVTWPYHPILYGFHPHPIVKNLDAISSKYVGTMDTIKSPYLRKTPLVYTTANTLVKNAPVAIDLNEARQNPDNSKFKGGNFPVVYLVEGKFESLYKNRPSPVPGTEVVVKSSAGAILICSDADIIRNAFDKNRKQPIPLGYDPDIKYIFSNKDFVQNAADYLMGESIVNIRGKEIILRPLDKVKIVEEKAFWQIINLLVPVLLLIIFALGRYYWRKRKYENF